MSITALDDVLLAVTLAYLLLGVVVAGFQLSRNNTLRSIPWQAVVWWWVKR